jgi:hypothetical protein
MIPIENSINISYGCMYDPSLPITPIAAEVMQLVKAELAF